MTMNFPSAVALFAEAVSVKNSPEDRATIKRAATSKSSLPLSDQDRDRIIAAIIREAMRAGKKSAQFSISDCNGAQMEVLAQHLREAGFAAEANPELTGLMGFFFTLCPCVVVRWNPSELAAQLSRQ